MHAFRNIYVDPVDAVKCGIVFEGKFYLDRALVFCAINGTMIFQRISDSIRYILANSNVEVCNYIDNIITAVEAEKGAGDLKKVCETIVDLGLQGQGARPRDDPHHHGNRRER